MIGEAGEVLEARSLKLGAIRLTDRFLRDVPLKRKAVEECRRYLEVREPAPPVLLAATGTQR